MENQSKYIMIERNKFAALVKVHRKSLQILSIRTYAHTMPRCALKTPGMPLKTVRVCRTVFFLVPWRGVPCPGRGRRWTAAG